MLRSLVFATLMLLSQAAPAAPPVVNLIVELRWVEASLAPVAQAAVRDGAVVVGTAGTISARGGVVTRTAPQGVDAVQRLTVLNGSPARVQTEHSEPIQWLDLAAEVDPATRQPSKVWAVPRSGERRTQRGFTITPSWPGGSAPVRVSFTAQGEAGLVESTALLALDVWTAVAQTDASGGATSERGTLSSRDAAPLRSLALQVRVSPAP